MSRIPASFSPGRTRWTVVGVLALVTFSGWAWWRWSTPRLNVILVTFDTTRADRLGAYGYTNGLTESFDEFARQGVLFERAYAPGPVTLPSHATMLTGLYPPEHGLRVNGGGRLSDQIPLLPEILKREGYDTGAFIAAVVLDSQHGLDRGFDRYDDDPPRKILSPHHPGQRRRDGEEMVDLALGWLAERTDRPFFCWLHLYDAHGPYDPRPQEYGARFDSQPYDAGIAWQLRQFARLTAFLKARRLDKNTLVVVAGDHGEGLDDHQEVEHGMLLYNTTLHVPLVFAGPSACRPGTRVATAVSLVDLAPTVLDLLRIRTSARFSGRSLRPSLTGLPIESREFYAETENPYLLNHWSPLYAVISDRWKYIQTTRPELYDLAEDFGELANLAESGASESQDMKNALALLQQSMVPVAAEALTLSAQSAENLKALGYVTGGKLSGALGDRHENEVLTDIKEMLPLLAKFENAKHSGLEGRVEETIGLLQEIVRETEKFPAAELMLADYLGQAGRLDEAAVIYRAVLAKRPDFTRVHFSLGTLLSQKGELDQAVAEFREYLRSAPDAASCHFELAQALVKAQKPDEAIAAYRAAIRHAPDFVAAYIALGQLLASLGRFQEAEASFAEAVATDPRSIEARTNLMSLLVQTRQFGKAIEQGREGVAFDPNSFEARYNLGVLLIGVGRHREGILELREARRLRPDDPRPAEQIQQAESLLRKAGG